MKTVSSAGLVAVILSAALLGCAPARAQDVARPGLQRVAPMPSEWSAQRRARLRGTPLRIYGRSGYLSPTAVRACNAWYEQEFRPSGTVIVPRMRCRWVNG